MDSKEQEKLYRETYKMVYWTCLSLLKNKEDAEDVMQETFITAFEAYDTLNDKSRAAAWIKRIAANKCINKLTRTRTVAVEDEFLDNVEAVPDDFLPSSITEDREKRSIMMNIISDVLSEELQRTLILYYFDEMTAGEISQLLGVPEGTVRSRLDYAKKKIKKGVEDYEKKNNDKLYAMVLPFLTELFVKEAEDLPFKPMPATLASLSASASAEVAKTVATTVIKKGNEFMIKKIIATALAATTLVGGGALTGVLIYKNVQKEKTIETRITKADVSEEPSDTKVQEGTVISSASESITEETSEGDPGTDLSKAAYVLTGTSSEGDFKTVVTYNANGDELVAKYSGWTNGTDETVRDRDGNILEVYSDGVLTDKYNYENGLLVRRDVYKKDGSPKGYYAFEYENGLVTKQSRVNPEGQTFDVFDYEYYGSGELKAVYETNAYGSGRLFEEYSEDGRTRITYMYLDGWTDPDGNLYGPNVLHGMIVYEYDDDHKLVKKTTTYEQDALDLVFGEGYTDPGNYEIYEYDENGYLKKQSNFMMDGTLGHWTDYEVTVY